MVIAIGIFKFELNMTPSGSIEPEFRLLRATFSEEFIGKEIHEFLTPNDLYKIYYALTTGRQGTIKNEKESEESKYRLHFGRLKDVPLDVICFYHQAVDDSQYLIVSIYLLDEDYEIFEDIIRTLTKRTIPLFHKLATGNLKNLQFLDSVYNAMEMEIKYAIFQIERLSNLTKTQKVGLIYFSEDRSRLLEILRNGPISRKTVFMELTRTFENLNLDQALRPFIELNLIRRDWAKGTRDKETGIISGQGEYLFLVKDVFLVRKPPELIIGQMKENQDIGIKYQKILDEFYNNYDPIKDIKKEGKLLGSFLLNPDTYDLMSLLSNRSYLREKMPKVLSAFSDPEQIIQNLIDAKILVSIKDHDDKEWLCSICEITPIVIFPEYVVKAIQNRYFSFVQGKDEHFYLEPLTNEIAKKGLDFLETTYDEKVEF